MLRVTSFDDEVLSHVRERVATNQVSGGLGLQYWMHAAHCRPEPLTRRTAGRRLVFGGPAPCEIDERAPRKLPEKVRCLSPSRSVSASRNPLQRELRVSERGRHEALEPHARHTHVWRLSLACTRVPPSLPLATLHTCPAHAPPAHVPPAFLCASLRRFSASGLGSACGHGAGAEPERSSDACLADTTARTICTCPLARTFMLLTLFSCVRSQKHGPS